jgi:hypothetical protein
VEDLSITEFAFSEEFRAAIEAKQVAEQNALRAEHELLQLRFIERCNRTLPQFLAGDETNLMPMITAGALPATSPATAARLLMRLPPERPPPPQRYRQRHSTATGRPDRAKDPAWP